MTCVETQGQCTLSLWQATDRNPAGANLKDRACIFLYVLTPSWPLLWVFTMKIRIYKNLANGLLSVLDPSTGLVIGHCFRATMTDVSFKVSAAGRRRVLERRQKNVHAFVEGRPYAFDGFVPHKDRAKRLCGLPSNAVLPSGAEFLASIRYNPYEMAEFQTALGCPIKQVPLCQVSSKSGILGFDIVKP